LPTSQAARAAGDSPPHTSTERRTKVGNRRIRAGGIAGFAAVAAGALLLAGVTSAAAPSAKTKTIRLTAVTTKSKTKPSHDGNSTVFYNTYKFLKSGNAVGTEKLVCTTNNLGLFTCGNTGASLGANSATVKGVGRNLGADMRWSNNVFTGGPPSDGTGGLRMHTIQVAEVTFKVHFDQIKKGKRFPVVIKRLLTPPISAYTGKTSQGKPIKVVADNTGKAAEVRFAYLWRTAPGCPTTANKENLYSSFKQHGRSFTVKLTSGGETGTVTGKVGKKSATGHLDFHQEATSGVPACDSGSVSWKAKK
jgi:hypothetical protein